MRLWSLFFSVILAILAAGCDGRSGKMVPVGGVVTYDGKPLETGTIVFRPEPSRSNTGREASGVIEPDGTYTLFTSAGQNSQEGAAPGWYNVGIVSTKEPDPTAKRIGAMPPPPTPLIPIEYADPARSGVMIEIIENAPPGAYDIQLKGSKKTP